MNQIGLKMKRNKERTRIRKRHQYLLKSHQIVCLVILKVLNRLKNFKKQWIEYSGIQSYSFFIEIYLWLLAIGLISFLSIKFAVLGLIPRLFLSFLGLISIFTLIFCVGHTYTVFKVKLVLSPRIRIPYVMMPL